MLSVESEQENRVVAALRDLTCVMVRAGAVGPAGTQEEQA